MTLITWQEKHDPLYGEYDTITGYDSITNHDATVEDDEVTDFIAGLDGEFCSNVQTQKL
jgi:hypothetical protein